MDSLFHFIFPIIGALAAKVHIKHPIRNILLVAALTVLIDIDHFIGLERATFHNVFITVLLPIAFIVWAFSLKKNFYMKAFSILLLIFLSSHVMLDVFTEPGVALLYPFSSEYYSIAFNVAVPLTSQFASEGLIISSISIGILLFFILVILPCYFLDEIIVIMEKKHESFWKAVKDLKH
ncbi:MAG: metal-dependent hydrolase [Nanoarchaeota archaeon]|nr:metal-dependent hydrolase [Nanoarchaeota archaeon]